MVNFNDVSFVRATFHYVSAKTQSDDAAVTYSSDIFQLDEGIQNVVKSRLIDSFGVGGKSFKLEINNTEQNSVYSLIHKLNHNPDSEFIVKTSQIADLLAQAQNKRSIPPGYLLILEGTLSDKSVVYVLIKAEVNSALHVTEQRQVQEIKNLILSPAQKLYKAVYFHEMNRETVNANDQYEVYLFDAHFNSGTPLAEYFLTQFLGLNIYSNSQVTTKLFYERMEAIAIKKYPSDFDTQLQIRDSFRNLMLSNINVINPIEQIRNIVPIESRDEFIGNLSTDFPVSFVRDTTLLDLKLRGRFIKITDSVRIYASSSDRITISQEREDSNVKIVRIEFNPNRNGQ
jgi:hypothetical protein